MARTHRRPVKPADQRILEAAVVRSTRITPNMVRLTVGGEQLRQFTPMGYDQWFRLFLPRAGQSSLALPRSASLTGYLHYLTMPERVRPLMRNYSVRAFRGAGTGRDAELDIDIVVHGHGLASSWAANAQPGEPVAVLDEGIGYAPPPCTGPLLLVADESGLSAVAGICAALPADASGDAFLEIPEPDDAQPLVAPAGVRVHWLPRMDAHAAPGRLALEAACRHALPVESFYTFVAGEAGLATGLRRYLLDRHQVPKSHIGFCDYWRDRPTERGTCR